MKIQRTYFFSADIKRSWRLQEALTDLQTWRGWSAQGDRPQSCPYRTGLQLRGRIVEGLHEPGPESAQGSGEGLRYGMQERMFKDPSHETSSAPTGSIRHIFDHLSSNNGIDV